MGGAKKIRINCMIYLLGIWFVKEFVLIFSIIFLSNFIGQSRAGELINTNIPHCTYTS